MKTIKRNDTGAAVSDVQRRLRVLGYSLAVDGVYLDRTQEAVRGFRASVGLSEGDIVDDDTWTALVDASFILGDRVLYLRMPYFHGGDVKTLQKILNVLGFVVGDADGIFGPYTEHALRELQSSVGIVDDGIVGTATCDVIDRLRHAWEGKEPAGSEAPEHLGLARVAEVLKRFEACFYGLDETGRGIASRVSNLARATTPETKITSADNLIGVAPVDALMVGISVGADDQASGTPVVELSEDSLFSTRLRTAIEAANDTPRRVIIQVPQSLRLSDDEAGFSERSEQHCAVVLLDAFCMALRV